MSLSFEQVPLQLCRDKGEGKKALKRSESSPPGDPIDIRGDKSTSTRSRRMERATRGKGRGGRGKGPARTPQLQLTTKTINWSVHETIKLLTATREIQLKINREDIKFTGPEWQQVHEAFQASGDFSHRTGDMGKNRLKVIRAEYVMIRDLLRRSGWGWDSARCVVMPPNDEAWDLLCKEGRKWNSFPQKSFPWYEQFTEIIGSSATAGDLGQTSVVQEPSGTSSSSGAHEYDHVPLDSEEQGRFDFESFHAKMEEDSVSQPVPTRVPNPGQPSAETGGTSSARSQSSNKRKSTDTVEGSRSQRAKRSVSNSQQLHEGKLVDVRELVKVSSRLAAAGEEFVDIARKKIEVPPNVVAALQALVLNPNDRCIAMRKLEKTIEQQIFMMGGDDYKINYLNSIIPGFMQRNLEPTGQNPQFNPFFNTGFFGGSAPM